MADDYDDFDPEDLEFYGSLLDQGVDPDDYVTITDEFGDVVLEGTFADLYDQTFMGAEEFAELYGDYTITDLIEDLEYAFDIEWDWETWRENYE